MNWLNKLWQGLKNLLGLDNDPQYPTPVKPPKETPKEEGTTSPENNNTDYPFIPLVKDTKIVGVDVFHYDKVVSFDKIKENYDFIIFKVSEGRSHEDTKYKEWIPMARAAGLVVGYYHFFRTNVDPIVQAKQFLAKVSPFLKPGDLCLVCDYETEDDKADGFDILEVEQFLKYIEEQLNWTPWIYSGHTLKQGGVAYQVPQRMKKYPLWLAHYSNTRPVPVVPAPWEKETVWQWSETAKVPGINNPNGTDVNRFNGTAEDFNALRYKGPAKK